MKWVTFLLLTCLVHFRRPNQIYQMNLHKSCLWWAVSSWLLMSLINIAVAVNNPAIVARHRLTSAEYQDRFTVLTQQSYRLLYISGYIVNNEERFAAYFEQSIGSLQICRHGMTNAQYQQAFNDATAQGYRLVLVNGYTAANGIDKYVAIWEKSAGSVAPWVARHGMTAAQYQSEFNSWTAKGFRLKHVSGYAFGSEAR